MVLLSVISQEPELAVIGPNAHCSEKVVRSDCVVPNRLGLMDWRGDDWFAIRIQQGRQPSGISTELKGRMNTRDFIDPALSAMERSLKIDCLKSFVLLGHETFPFNRHLKTNSSLGLTSKSTRFSFLLKAKLKSFSKISAGLI